MSHLAIPMVSAAEFAAVAAAVDAQFGVEATHKVFSQYGFSRKLLDEPEMQIANTEYMRFLEACARVTCEPLLGAKIGDSVPFSDLGLYGQYVSEAPSLTVALERASRALKYHESGSRLTYQIEGQRLSLIYVPPTPRAIGSWHQSDGVAAMLINLVKEYEAPHWKPSQIKVAAATKVRQVELRAFFGVDIQDSVVGTEVTGEISVPQSINRSRRKTFNWSALRQLVSKRPPETFGGTMRILTGPLARRGIFDLSQIADCIGVAPRTIQRRLAAEGTTFGSILQGARREWAEDLLVTTSLTMPEIAGLLGYTSKQHFIRAYRDWSGLTPASRRSKNRNFQCGRAQ
ncbi:MULTISPECIES: AraC family transcriptional regulator [Falsihalocynthiibacter]|uniref:AraC family transcriptional regulator n=1 Tax=Falsihalocynthiibacter TaxID=2854182 RepID=UPI00300358D3